MGGHEDLEDVGVGRKELVGLWRCLLGEIWNFSIFRLDSRFFGAQCDQTRCASPYVRMVKVLLERGADANAEKDDHSSPLMATWEGHVAVDCLKAGRPYIYI